MIERILALLEERGVTAYKLTSDLGLALSTVTQWKKGKAKPSYGALVKIADYFNVSVEYLQGTTDDPAPSLNTKKTAAEKLGGEIMQMFIEAGRLAPGEELTDELKEYATNLIRAAVAMEKNTNKG